jgi:hypothetical protein
MRRLLKPVVEPVRALTGSKVIDSRMLNLAGVQVVRALAAQAAYRTRRFETDVAPEAVEELQKEGCVVIPSLVDPELLDRARGEALEALENDRSACRTHDAKGATVEQLDLRQVDRSRYPALTEIVENPVVSALFSGAERQPVDPWERLSAVERVTQLPAQFHDVESDLHTDIFFNTHKAWLYLDDVRPEMGPFVFVPRSHLLSAERLRRIYDESVTTNRGSRRITAEELASQGGSEKTFTCPANTLVAANTCGFHRRKRGVEGQVRLAIHFSVRSNPFFPHWMAADRWLSRRNPVVRWLTGNG